MNQVQSRPADSWRFTTAKTVVMVVDMQNIWAHPRGARYLPTSKDIALLRYCHNRKIPSDIEAAFQKLCAIRN